MARKPTNGRTGDAQGTPEDIVKAKAKPSYTGQFLKPGLERRETKRKKGVQATE